jgi:hypothetical protein
MWRYVTLHLRSDMTVGRDGGGLLDARRNPIVGTPSTSGKDAR